MPTPALVSGSNQTVKLTVYDNVGGVNTLMDLSGTTVKIRPKLNGVMLAEWTATPDPDQVANKGKATYKLAVSDLPTTTPGLVELHVRVTLGADVFPSSTIEVGVEPND